MPAIKHYQCVLICLVLLSMCPRCLTLPDTCAMLQTAEGDVAIRRSIQGMLEELEPNLWEHCLSRLVRP